jgi:hypothetical protein
MVRIWRWALSRVGAAKWSETNGPDSIEFVHALISFCHRRQRGLVLSARQNKLAPAPDFLLRIRRRWSFDDIRSHDGYWLNTIQNWPCRSEIWMPSTNGELARSVRSDFFPREQFPFLRDFVSRWKYASDPCQSENASITSYRGNSLQLDFEYEDPTRNCSERTELGILQGARRLGGRFDCDTQSVTGTFGTNLSTTCGFWHQDGSMPRITAKVTPWCQKCLCTVTSGQS